MSTERAELIYNTYAAALAGRDPRTVSVFDLLPAIEDAVPDATLEEIGAALEWAASRAMREADELRQYAATRRRAAP